MSFRPIMFYLLCLSDNDEVGDLIKREIDARTRFLVRMRLIKLMKMAKDI